MQIFAFHLLQYRFQILLLDIVDQGCPLFISLDLRRLFFILGQVQVVASMVVEHADSNPSPQRCELLLYQVDYVVLDLIGLELLPRPLFLALELHADLVHVDEHVDSLGDRAVLLPQSIASLHLAKIQLHVGPGATPSLHLLRPVVVEILLPLAYRSDLKLYLLEQLAEVPPVRLLYFGAQLAKDGLQHARRDQVLGHVARFITDFLFLKRLGRLAIIWLSFGFISVTALRVVDRERVRRVHV